MAVPAMAIIIAAMTNTTLTNKMIRFIDATPFKLGRDSSAPTQLPRTPLGNCPKRGSSNAPTMNLTDIQGTKWAEKSLFGDQ